MVENVIRDDREEILVSTVILDLKLFLHGGLTPLLLQRVKEDKGLLKI
jgi:hypothetical protein